jgi:GT2 family glycosyltransferase
LIDETALEGAGAQHVTAAIVAWNGGEDIAACVASVLRQSILPTQRLVVDNGSSDGSVDNLHRVDPDLEIIRNESNVGFARAANQAFAAARGEWLLLLNQDVVLEPNYVEALLDVARRKSHIGSISGKLIRLGPGERIIDSTGHILYRNGWAANRGEWEIDEGQYESVQEVFGVCAAAALYRMEMLRESCTGVARPFDERFVSYHEDVDLDWRARWLGWHAWYVPAVAWHRRGGSELGWTPQQIRRTVANRLMLVGNNDLWPQGLARLPAVLAFGFAGVVRSMIEAPVVMLGPIDALRRFRSTKARRRFIASRQRVAPNEISVWMRPYPLKQRLRALVSGESVKRRERLRRSATPRQA